MTRNPGKGTVLERGVCLAVALIAVVATDLRGKSLPNRSKPPVAEKPEGRAGKAAADVKQQRRAVPRLVPVVSRAAMRRARCRRGPGRERVSARRPSHAPKAGRFAEVAGGRPLRRGRPLSGRDSGRAGRLLFPARQKRSDSSQPEGRGAAAAGPDAARGPRVVRIAVRRPGPANVGRGVGGRATSRVGWPRFRGDSFTPAAAIGPRFCWGWTTSTTAGRWPGH